MILTLATIHAVRSNQVLSCERTRPVRYTMLGCRYDDTRQFHSFNFSPFCPPTSISSHPYPIFDHESTFPGTIEDGNKIIFYSRTDYCSSAALMTQDIFNKQQDISIDFLAIKNKHFIARVTFIKFARTHEKWTSCYIVNRSLSFSYQIIICRRNNFHSNPPV